MTKPALILFGHGARDPQWAQPLQRVQLTVQARDPARSVSLAFLEFMEPTLSACVLSLAEQGVTEARIVPMFMAQSGHLKRDLPLLIEQAQQQCPGLRLFLTEAIGESPDVIAAMASHVLSLE